MDWLTSSLWTQACELAELLPNKRLLQSRQPSTSRATLAVTTLAAQQNRRSVSRAQMRLAPAR